MNFSTLNLVIHKKDKTLSPCGVYYINSKLMQRLSFVTWNNKGENSRSSRRDEMEMW
jgi:hypothetical protein